MKNIRFIILFSSLIGTIYFLRSYNDLPNPQFSDHGPRLLGALKDKFCSGVSITQPTSSDIANAADFRSQFFQTMRNNENKLKVAITNSDYITYVKSLIIPTIVWLIFLGLSIIGWICYCMCCCCDKQCPPCKSCRRDLDSHPYKGFELWGLVLFLVIFGTGIVGISAAGILYSTQVQTGIESTVCSLVSIYDDVVYGTTYNLTQWLGIYPVMDRINLIITDLANIPNQFYSTFGDTSWINTGINNLLMQNRNIYTKYQGSQLSSPNPSNPSISVPSLFIQNTLGPYTANGTMTQSIETQFQTSSVVFSSSLQSVYSSSKSVADTAGEISLNLNSGTNEIHTVYDSLKSYEGQIDSTLSTPQGYFNQINTGFYVAWSVNIVAAVLGLIGAIGVYLLKWSRLRILLHCSWCAMSALMVLGFALASVFVPVGIITIEGCDLYSDIISSQTQYNKYTEIIPSDVNSKLQTCFFGSGDLLSEFGIASQVAELNSIYSSFSNLSSFSNNNLNSSNSLSYSDILIDSWHTATNKLFYGLMIDSSESDDNNSFVSIGSFNKWSDYSSSGSLQAISCTYTQDNWVFNFSNCTYSTQWNSTNSPTDSLGNPVCIQIQDFDSSGASSRYSSMGSCSSSVSSNNLAYFSALKNYDISRRTLFGNIGTDLTSLKTNNDNYNSQLYQFNQTVYGFITNIQDFVGNVSDPNNGLVNGFNCAFLKNTAQDSYNSMCVSLFMPIYLQVIFICTTSLLMFLMSLLAYLAGMRFGKLQKHADINNWGGESKS